MVGLDKPCRQCGKPIYFHYRGPIEGLCGRCTDRTRRAPRMRPRSRGVGMAAKSPRRGLGLFVAAAVVAAALLTLLALPRLL